MYTPDFSPDGSRIVFVSGRGAHWDNRRYSLATVRAGGGGHATSSSPAHATTT